MGGGRTPTKIDLRKCVNIKSKARAFPTGRNRSGVGQKSGIGERRRPPEESPAGSKKKRAGSGRPRGPLGAGAGGGVGRTEGRVGRRMRDAVSPGDGAQPTDPDIILSHGGSTSFCFDVAGSRIPQA